MIEPAVVTVLLWVIIPPSVAVALKVFKEVVPPTAAVKVMLPAPLVRVRD